MSCPAPHLTALAAEPILAGWLGETPTFAGLDGALRRFGTPTFLLTAHASFCSVRLTDGDVVTATSPRRADPSGAGLTCLLTLVRRLHADSQQLHAQLRA